MNVESYIEGLRYELKGAINANDAIAVEAVKAELGRVTGRRETVVPVVKRERRRR